MSARICCLLSCSSLIAFVGCGSEETGAPVLGAGSGASRGLGEEASPGVENNDSEIQVPEDAGTGGSDGGLDEPREITIEETLPEGFVAADGGGGWKVLGPIADYAPPESNSCANVLRLIIRDFSEEHPDFGARKPASFFQDGLDGLYTGQILPQLDEQSSKPVSNPLRVPLDLMEKFEDWFVNIEGTNRPYVMDLWLEPDPQQEGIFVFDSSAFFPLDGPEYIDQADEVMGHNFGFTTELRTAFEYKGGEIFRFRGDDDVFVFIDGKLAVDIGGIHNAFEETLDLDAQADALGLMVGSIYDLVLFQAERNPGASNYRIETSLDFRSCEILPNDIVVK